MTRINIDYCKEKKNILLSGEINKIINNRYIMRFLRDYFVVSFLHDSIILTNEKFNDIEALSLIQKCLEKNGIILEKKEAADNVIKNYFQEEENFKEFSKLALDIRNNNCNIQEFTEFSNLLMTTMIRKLYPLQLLSSYHLAFAQNACNFSVPGAGKTSIVYGAYSFLKSLDDFNKKVERIMIVGPLSSFGPWENEYEECFGRKANVIRINGLMSKEQKINYFYSQHPAEITLISYASLVNVKEDIIYFLKKHNVMVVLDEAHKIKNINGGIIASSILEISRYCKSRVVLTGTPAPNGYEDLFNLYKFIWPNRKLIKYRPNQLIEMSKNPKDLRIKNVIETIAPYFIRIKKSDLKLPPPTENVPNYVKMNSSQRKIYDYIENKYIQDIINNDLDFSNKFKASLLCAKTIRLMQAASNPTLLLSPLEKFIFEEEGIENIDDRINDEYIIDLIRNCSNETPSKFLKALEIIEKIIQDNGKVIIWVSFIKTLKDFQVFLQKSNIKCEVIYGDTPIDGNDDIDTGELTREQIIREFHDSNSFKVIIANPHAVSESISLHKACHNAIYLERSFNAAHFIQSKDRIHRYGLKDNEDTNYYYIISEDSIEEVIDVRLHEKEIRLKEIMESMPIPLFNNIVMGMGNDDINLIIRNYVERNKKI